MLISRPSQASHSSGGITCMYLASTIASGRVCVDLAADLRERRRLAGVVAGHRDVPERQAEQRGDRLEIGVVADDDADVRGHLAGVPAGQQLVQAVALLGDQQHHRLPVGAVGDLPAVGLQLAGDHARIARAARSMPNADRVCPDLLPGEEPARFVIGVVGGLGDPAADVGQEGGDARDDAGPVRAAQGQHEAVIVRQAVVGGHGVSCCHAVNRRPVLLGCRRRNGQSVTRCSRV